MLTDAIKKGITQQTLKIEFLAEDAKSEEYFQEWSETNLLELAGQQQLITADVLWSKYRKHAERARLLWELAQIMVATEQRDDFSPDGFIELWHDGTKTIIEAGQ